MQGTRWSSASVRHVWDCTHTYTLASIGIRGSITFSLQFHSTVSCRIINGCEYDINLLFPKKSIDRLEYKYPRKIINKTDYSLQLLYAKQLSGTRKYTRKIK